MLVMFVFNDIDPPSEDTLHSSISEVAIGNAVAVSALFAFLKAMMPLVKSPMHYLHLMLILHLFTHLIHKPTSLPVENQA